MVYIVRNFYNNQIVDVFSTRERAEEFIRINDDEFGSLDIIEKEVR